MKIKNFPAEIYAIGNIELLNSKYAVGVVGSRKCTEYGRRVTNEFAKELSKNEICVVSGMAIGIDGVAHNAAIEEQGKTIAVLGGGHNHIYPTENEWLFHKILEKGGCIISEYPPDTKVDKNKFPKRNRIISGLSDVLLVVEAEYRSGSSITAKYAKIEGKSIYAVPNNIYCSTSIGTNKLIQEGAILVTKPTQIIEELKQGYTQRENTNRYLKEERGIIRIMPTEYLQIYRILSDEPIHINEIAKMLNKTIKEINPAITMMELEEYIIQPQTNYFVRKDADIT